MPFVLLAGEKLVAQGPDPEFGALGPNERVEFWPDGSAWDEADRLKAEVVNAERARDRAKKRSRRKELGGRLVFAITDMWRFAAHRSGPDVVAHCTRFPIGSHEDMNSKMKRKIEQLQALGDRGEWCDVRASDLLVALDEWREAGCPRRVWKRLDWETATGPVRSKT